VTVERVFLSVGYCVSPHDAENLTLSAMLNVP